MSYAAPTVVAGGSGTGSGGALTITRPTALRIGDLILLIVATSGSATPYTPSGFSEIGGEVTRGTHTLRAWCKFAGHQEPTSYRVALSASAESVYHVLLVRGVTPMDVVNGRQAGAGEQILPIATPSVVTDVAQCLAITAIAMEGSGRVLEEPTGWTAVDDQDSATALSTAVASKAVATAGATGTNTWSATDESSGEYVALTIALAPGVMGRDPSVLYSPQILLAYTLADCDEFRNLVGAANHGQAMARIWHEALPEPEGGSDHYSQDELEEYRPFALIFTNDIDGHLSDRVATFTFSDSGTLRVLLELQTPDRLADSPVLLDHWMKQTIGRIIQRGPEEASTFNGLRNLAHLTNETGGYSYLAIDGVSFRGWHRADQRDQHTQGDYCFAWLEVRYGQGGGA